MDIYAQSAAGFLVDGFPRNKNNLDGWQKEMGNKTNVRFVLILRAPLDICTERCLSRNEGRSDDNEVFLLYDALKFQTFILKFEMIYQESMRKRIVTYNNHTVPIIDYYNSLHLVKEVDSSKPVNEVRDLN